MTHLDIMPGRSLQGFDAIPRPPPRLRAPNPRTELQKASQPLGLVHVIDVDDDAQLLLTRWLAAAGIEARSYACITSFLSAHHAELPGCLVIDAQPRANGGVEPQTIPLHLAVRCPIIVTAWQADVAMAVRAMKTGAIDFVEKPLHEREIVAAVCAAIEVDRQQRLVASRRADVHARFATLTRRERQVMALVTAGKMNKQAAGDLGLSEITIKAHRGAVMRKMQARSLADLVRMADAIGEAWGEEPARNDCSVSPRTAAGADRHSGYNLAP